MRRVVLAFALLALALAAVWGHVSARSYTKLLVATIASGTASAAGFLYLLLACRGSLKWVSGICLLLALLCVVDAVVRILS